MIITHNMASINTNRQLGINQDNASKSLEKLSSGFRINKAGDDAAGLAISEKMRGQIRGLDQASRNSQDGISLIQTAEGSLSETQNILQRMKELATQSANDTNVNADRSEIQKEMNQLSSEVNRIGNTTEFNTKKLLNGGGETLKASLAVTTAGGTSGDTAAFSLAVASVAETVGKYSASITTAATSGATITIGGQSFTGVTGVADATRGQFSVDGVASAQTASLAAAIDANTVLHAQYENTSLLAGGIQLQERKGQATAAAFTISGVGGGVVVASGTVSASIKEVQGKYTINLDKAFQTAGATLTISGATSVFTAVKSNADPAVGQFNITSDRSKQAAQIAAAMNADALFGAHYEATVKDTTITMTEKKTTATAVNLSASNFFDGGTSAKGVYNIGFVAPTANGGKITIDGVDIDVTSNTTDAGLANGNSMIAGGTMTQQITNLANAVNSNTALNGKYTASITGDKLTLTQKTGKENVDAPVVTTNTSNVDGFQASLQIGANTAQSMTLTVADMRSKALNITTDDATKATVTAKNGSVASFTQTTSVSDGTTNDNVEFSLDVSTHEKATAAISVLDDAIQGVSAQRSQLGAFQNRLEHTISNLGTSSENLTAAESRVRDVDMAKEMMNFQKNNILQQAATAMMAQANQLPQGVLQLLR